MVDAAEISYIASIVTYVSSTYIHFINIISSGNDIVKGMLNVTILGSFGWLIRGLPTRIVFLIKSLCIVSITMRSERHRIGDHQYDIVLAWISKQKHLL
jgi:di/tricarboxylate transporter